MDHPESLGSPAIEPTVGELLRLRKFRDGLSKLREEELRELCSQLAEQALVLYPSALRWLGRETCRYATDAHQREMLGDELVRRLTEEGRLQPPPLED